jgi:hypothetical protein
MINFEKLTNNFMWEIAPLIYKGISLTSNHHRHQIDINKITPILYYDSARILTNATWAEKVPITVVIIHFNEKGIVIDWRIKPFTTLEKPYPFLYEDPTTTPEKIAEYIIGTYKKYKPQHEDR